MQRKMLWFKIKKFELSTGVVTFYEKCNFEYWSMKQKKSVQKKFKKIFLSMVFFFI